MRKTFQFKTRGITYVKHNSSHTVTNKATAETTNLTHWYILYNNCENRILLKKKMRIFRVRVQRGIGKHKHCLKECLIRVYLAPKRVESEFGTNQFLDRFQNFHFTHKRYAEKKKIDIQYFIQVDSSVKITQIESLGGFRYNVKMVDIGYMDMYSSFWLTTHAAY